MEMFAAMAVKTFIIGAFPAIGTVTFTGDGCRNCHLGHDTVFATFALYALFVGVCERRQNFMSQVVGD